MITVRVHCDALRVPTLREPCQETFLGNASTSETARKYAEREGWGRLPHFDGLDVCPAHFREYKATERRDAGIAEQVGRPDCTCAGQNPHASYCAFIAAPDDVRHHAACSCLPCRFPQRAPEGSM